MTPLIIPPITDLSVYLREPGMSHKSTIAQTQTLALAAGVGRMAVQPETRPVTDSPQTVAFVLERARAVHGVEVLLLGALTKQLEGVELAEMVALQRAGCVGISNAGRGLPPLQVLRRALKYAGSLGLTVHLQAIDRALSAAGVAHAGQVATRMGLVGIPESAETCALAAIIELVRETGCRVHVGRVSCARSVELIARAKADRLTLSCDVAWRQLYFTEIELIGFDAQMHVVPPLRTHKDRMALLDGVASGVIDAICSDHQPHDVDAKLAPFPSTEAGRADMPLLLKQTLKLVVEGYVPLARALDAIGARPDWILGQSQPPPGLLELDLDHLEAPLKYLPLQNA